MPGDTPQAGDVTQIYYSVKCRSACGKQQRVLGLENFLLKSSAKTGPELNRQTHSSGAWMPVGFTFFLSGFLSLCFSFSRDSPSACDGSSIVGRAMGGNKDHPRVLKLPASILKRDWFRHTHTVFASPGKCCGGGSGCLEEISRGGWSDP